MSTNKPVYIELRIKSMRDQVLVGGEEVVARLVLIVILAIAINVVIW